MKNATLIAVLTAAMTSFGQSYQTQDHSHFGPVNHLRCNHNMNLDAMYAATPALKTQDSLDQIQFEIEYQQYLQDYDPNARAAYVVPVVVHIVHLGGEDNISNEQVYDAIEKLNEDFSMTNSDLANTVAPFATITGNPDIEFRLATKDPSQNCHLGITRTYSVHTNHDGDNDIISAIQSQHGNWPSNKYMNIIVCQDPNGAAGYTYKPSNWNTGMQAGIFMRHDYMGTIGTGSNLAKHTLSHEAGHWFNLSHAWGDGNNPGQASACNDDDGVDDTPRTIGWQSCNVNGNTCSNDAVDGYWTSDVIDNVQNIMEYSFCSTMFTQGQAAKIQTAINSGTAGRDDLWQTSNLNATGTNGTTPLCLAEFSSDVTVICAGQSIEFFDESYHTVSSRTWTFDGGSPASSGDQDPVITYNTAGLYNVSLQVSDGSTSLTESKTSYILVLADPGTAPPYSEGFENLTAIPNNQNWLVINNNSGNAWSWTSATGAGGSSKCAKLQNYGNSDETTDELISETIDLSGVALTDNVVFNFEYAYRKRTSSTNEKLQVYISKNCGETWVLRKNISGDNLSSVISSSAYTPASAEDWYYSELTNINSDYYVSDFRFKFVFTNDGGNNIYIDNINIYPGAMVDLVDNKKQDRLSVYPNPAKDFANIDISGQEGIEYTITIHSAVGQQVGHIYQGELTNGVNHFEYNSESLAKGIYIVRIESEGKVQSVKLTKE